MLSDEEMAKIDQLQTDFKYKGYGIGSGFGDSARLRKKSVERGGASGILLTFFTAQ